jgi:hypothetical protein
MWIVLGIVVLSIVIAFIEAPSLLKRGLKKELWIFSILLLLGTGFSIAESMQAKIPNPLDALAFIYQPLIRFIFG